MSSDDDDGAVAIVGMACLFPGAPDLDAYWRLVRSGGDAIAEVPPDRLDRAVLGAGRWRGGLVSPPPVDAAALGVMPQAARGAEPDQLLTLHVASRALADAGYHERPFPRERAAVILGRGGYPGAGRARFADHVRTAEQLAASLRALLPGVDEAALERVKAELRAGVEAARAEAVIGLVPNLVAARVAHRLDLHGPAFTVDAACASALVAVDHACRELATRRADLVLTGGVHLGLDEVFWRVFAELGALSPSGQSRPFDRRADGLVIGEGIGVVALKRLGDAVRDDDRVYAVVRGAGVASDGRGASLMSPSVAGQVRALAAAWQAAARAPESVGLVEAHGTATPAGDAAELATLARVFGRAAAGEARAALGSVKALIGHAMPAAGAAGLIKAALAVYHGVLPPSRNCDEPHALLGDTRFRVLAAAEPWEARPRRAGVDAFGFGGINAHVVLEEHAAPRPRRRHHGDGSDGDGRIARFSAPDVAALLADLDAGRERDDGGAARLALLAPSAERRGRARDIVARGRPWRGRDAIWFTPRGLISDGGTLAFVFPGVDADFAPRVDDVAAALGLPVPPCTRPQGLYQLGLGVISVNRLVDIALGRLGIVPADIAGHSIGEWSGMVAAGLSSEAEIDAFVGRFGADDLKVPGVVFAAAGCGVTTARAALAGLDEVALSHDNCPHQVVLCGREAAIDVVIERLRATSVLCQKLAFQSGFHSPLFADYVEPYRSYVARVALGPPRVPMWSATTAAPYPRDAEAVRALTLRHLVEPVRFRELVLALYARGTRVFVQAGTGSLAGFVADTLAGQPHLAIAANVKERSGLDQLRRVAAALFVEGVAVDFAPLAATATATATRSVPVTLALGAPLVRTLTPLAIAPPTLTPSTPSPSPGHALAADFAAGLDAVLEAQRAVAARLAAPAARPVPTPPPSPPSPRTLSLARVISLDLLPELHDHAFYRQPPGWPVVHDRYPVVPMTTLLDLMGEYARELVPGRVVIAVEQARAYRWFAVPRPVSVDVTCTSDGNERVHVRMGDYCEATCVLAERYPEAPLDDDAALAPAASAAESGALRHVPAASLYAERWLFHGPAFQGLIGDLALAPRAVRADIVTPAARGALLDNAGQALGYWAMTAYAVNRLVMPVGIDRVRYFGPHPRAGERLTCTARLRAEADERAVVGDLTLGRDGRAWAIIEGWTDRRFETDARLWQVLLWPESSFLAEPQPEGFVLLRERYRSAPARDQLARRYLGEGERADYEQQGPRRQRGWLNGRIAAKDAARRLLGARGHRPLFPVEVALANEPSGRPVIRISGGIDLSVSIAHKDDLAVALVRPSSAGAVGIDVERIVARGDGFGAHAFGDGEAALVADLDRDEAWTRLWVAKEAVAKARGLGLGDPRRLVARDRAGARLLVDGLWVETRRDGDYVIGWTCATEQDGAP